MSLTLKRSHAMNRTIGTHQFPTPAKLFSKHFITFLFTLAILAGGVAQAQLSGKGELKGTVKDPTGAMVANATVTATENTTGLSTSRPSNASGEYEISPL